MKHMPALTLSQVNDQQFRVTADGLDTGLLTRDEALGELARSIYATWHTSYLKPCSPRPAPVVTDALNEAERQQANAWLGVANLLTTIAPGWVLQAPSAAESARVYISAMDNRIITLREEVARLKGLDNERAVTAWRKIIDVLDEVCPGWKKLTGSIHYSDSAVQAIKNLATKAVVIDPTIVKPPVRECPPVDTLVEVRNTNFDEWVLRYSTGAFKDNKLSCWDYGATSKTTTRYCSWVQWRLPKDNDGWIDWKGGNNPLIDNLDIFAEVKLRSGDTIKCMARLFNWAHSGNVGAQHTDESDIVAYREISLNV